MSNEKNHTEMFDDLFRRIIVLEQWNQRLSEHVLKLSGVVLVACQPFDTADGKKIYDALNDAGLLCSPGSCADGDEKHLPGLVPPILTM